MAAPASALGLDTGSLGERQGEWFPFSMHLLCPGLEQEPFRTRPGSRCLCAQQGHVWAGAAGVQPHRQE